MREPAALQAALSLAKRPTQVRMARREPLPRGMTFLLEVAAGDDTALAAARQLTGRTDDVLRQAAGFFIEQTLLGHDVDSYRVLGSTSEVSQETLRRHMVLLMKWLHPDIAAHQRLTAEIDRSVFANRVTGAWDSLKTSKRRAAYDQDIKYDRQGRSGYRETSPTKLSAVGKRRVDERKGQKLAIPQKQFKRRSMPKIQRRENFLDRVARFLWNQR